MSIRTDAEYESNVAAARVTSSETLWAFLDDDTISETGKHVARHELARRREGSFPGQIEHLRIGAAMMRTSDLAAMQWDPTADLTYKSIAASEVRIRALVENLQS